MEQRLALHRAAPDAQKAMLALSAYVEGCGLEKGLMELVKTRASQINGCAYCLHMHTRDARAAGESEVRLHLLAAWQESSLYTPRERAALAWTEALTRLSATGDVPDALYDSVRQQFSEEEMGKLSLAVATINAWNRIAVGFRYQHPA